MLRRQKRQSGDEFRVAQAERVDVVRIGEARDADFFIPLRRKDKIVVLGNHLRFQWMGKGMK